MPSAFRLACDDCDPEMSPVHDQERSAEDVWSISIYLTIPGLVMLANFL